MSDNNSNQHVAEVERLLNTMENEVSELYAQQDQMLSMQALQLSAQEKMERDANDIITKLNELGHKSKPQCINQLIKQHDITDITAITSVIKIDDKHIAISAEHGSIYVYTINIDTNSSSLQFIHKNAHDNNINCMLLWSSRLITADEDGCINV